MLTASYLQRSLFKWKCALLIILIIAAAAPIFSFQINRWLPNYALSFSGLIAQQFHTKISFGTVHYRFPDSIIFKDVTVLAVDNKPPLLETSRVTLGLFFNNIVINDMAVDFPALKNYLALHGKEIHVWARTLPKRDMHLFVPNGRFYAKGLHGEPIAFKVDLKRNGDHINAHGYWDDNDRSDYTIDGNIRNSGFDLNKLSLENSKSSINLWGSWHGNDITWKGFIFYERFYILDIDGSLDIRDKDIILKRLSFSVNGNGVGALGHCSRQNLFQCDADIALKNIKLHLDAQNTPHGPVFKGAADVDGAHVDFEHLTGLIINGASLKLKVKKMRTSFAVQGNKYSVPLEDLLASFNVDDPYQKTISLSARMFRGYSYGRIFVDTSSVPWQIKTQGGFNGKNINFDDTYVQAWAVKTLQMPSLSHISGADLSYRFTIDGKSKTVEDLKLNTDDLNLGGSFHLDADDLVSSQGSVRFSKKLLSESPVGRHIIGLVRGAWTLPFEFSLSGDVDRMNFEWDNSPLKDKVRQHLFSFFEKMIDRRMDARPAYKVTIPSESVSPG